MHLFFVHLLSIFLNPEDLLRILFIDGDLLYTYYFNITLDSVPLNLLIKIKACLNDVKQMNSYIFYIFFLND